ncbi:MAG: hypothetical protein RMK93_08670 [Bacteroidota bacterium]|nr:hypothetical protein [Bacteroidota bacterium]
MTTDERVQLAQLIAKELKQKWELEVRNEAKQKRKDVKPKDLEFPKNEWEKWVNYIGRMRFSRSLQLLEYMRRSPSLREDPKRAARIAHEVIHRIQEKLQVLDDQGISEVLGYVGRWLVYFNTL